jgi:glycosyltransferase involved in cell wall biosynthesis
MPCFNDRDVLTESIGSALSQTWPRIELIVVDDGSTDGTRDLLSRLRDDRVTVAYKRNGGPSSARNFGLRLLSPASEYVAFLDSDDVWMPSFLEKAIGALRAGGGTVGLAYCDSELSVDGRFREIMNPEYTWPKLIGGWGLIPTGAFAVTRAAADKAGQFDDDIERGEDMEWMWRVGLRHDFVHVRETLHRYRRSSGGQLSTATMNVDGLDRRRRQCLAIRGLTDPPAVRRSGGQRAVAPGAKRAARGKDGAK